jgi:hypothetical protein
LPRVSFFLDLGTVAGVLLFCTTYVGGIGFCHYVH